MSEVPSVPDSVLYTIILRWDSVALIRLRVFPFSNVYRFPVMMVNVSNLEHYRTLLLLVVRGIRESRLPWEVFVNCLEAGLCVWFADVRKGKIRFREERGWTHSRTPEGNERASCLEKRESHEPTLIEVNFRTCWKQLAAVMKQDVVDRRDAQCGIWMRIRLKNQKSLATFVTFARSHVRRTGSHVYKSCPRVSTRQNLVERRKILTKKSEIRGRVTDELDERFPHGLADHAVGRDDVCNAEERKEDADPDDLQRLEDHVFPSEAWKTFVPNRCE